MLRLLFLALIVGALVWGWRRLTQTRPTPSPAESNFTPMVRCAQCRLHLPQKQAVQSHGQWYCCPEHLAQHQKKPNS